MFYALVWTSKMLLASKHGEIAEGSGLHLVRPNCLSSRKLGLRKHRLEKSGSLDFRSVAARSKKAAVISN